MIDCKLFIEKEAILSIRKQCALLGHSDPSELRSYDNLQTNIIKQQVEQAHVNILKEFNVDELLIILRDKISTLNVPKYIYEYGSVYLKEDANINEYYNDCFLM